MRGGNEHHEERRKDDDEPVFAVLGEKRVSLGLSEGVLLPKAFAFFVEFGDAE